MLPKFSWKITKQKKKIGSLIVHTTFRGRKYMHGMLLIAVYSGPWKLNGLPGMIRSV
jgi:GLPGLI family protein